MSVQLEVQVYLVAARYAVFFDGFGIVAREMVQRDTHDAETGLLVQGEGAQAGIARGHHQAREPGLARFRDQVAHDVRTMLGLRTMVEVVDPGTYPRTDFKARRVIDDREVFKDMQQRLQAGAA